MNPKCVGICVLRFNLSWWVAPFVGRKIFFFQQVGQLPITWTQLGPLLGQCQPQGNHTFSAFWLRSSVVSVLISLISGTCYTVANEINCYVWATSMDQAPGLLAFQDRGPGFALLPGAARRFTPHELNNCWRIAHYWMIPVKTIHFLGPYIDVSRPVTLSPGWALLEGSPGYIEHSQPVLKKLVCNESTLFLEWCEIST